MKYVLMIFFSFVILALAVFHVNQVNLSVFSVDTDISYRTVVLDAGHGGEDGGAVAPDLTNEKDINLSITNDIAAFFELFDIPYISVRTTDISVCDEGLDTVKKRKVSDIYNRQKLVQSVPNAILLSIHQNKYTTSDCKGAQIFYSANTADSEVLAQDLKSSIVSLLQPENTRETKPSGSSIYLLYQADYTAVLCECGFLSNPRELSLLKTRAYQTQMAYAVFKGLFHFQTNAKEL